MLKRIALGLGILLPLTSTALAHSPSSASQARSFPPPPVRARAAVVMDATSGKVLAGVNASLRLPMASTTKIMTAVLGLQMGHLSDRITVPKSAFDFEWDATVMGLKPGQVVTLRDLLYGLLLPSGADAANTIAIHYGGSEAHFAQLMNAQADRLGMKDTHYVNAHGLTADHHYTTAFDLALLARYATSFPDLMAVVSTRSYTWNGHVLTNLNHVLFWYPGVDGIKPGYTDDAGICQVLDAQRNGHRVVVTILNTPDLVIDARNLLNFGLGDFTWIQSPLMGDGPALMQRGIAGGGPFGYFPASGHYVRGAFYSAYFAAGGPATLGFPRTEPLAGSSSDIQYFENGALALDRTTHRVTRVALGLTPVPSSTVQPTATATPPPTRVPTPRSTPSEGTIVPKGTGTVVVSPVAGGTSTPVLRGSPTPTPKPRPTVRPATPTPTLTPTPVTSPQTASAFTLFVRSHAALLGQAAQRMYTVAGYQVQIFEYGALVYDPKTRAVSLLPLGDHLLAARHYLPAHPGNRYPAGFASETVLRSIGWWPNAVASASR